MNLRCDCCGKQAPDLVGPILCGIEGWSEVAVEGVVVDDAEEWAGRKYTAELLLCGHRSDRRGGPMDDSCSTRMERFIEAPDSGIQAPEPKTFQGGIFSQPKWDDADEYDPKTRIDPRRNGSRAVV